jgi:hypothetical protein
MFKNFNFFLSSALFLRSLSRIRIRIWNPHLECGFRMRIQETKSMRIHADADADPQHCSQGTLIHISPLLSKLGVQRAG